LLTNKQADKTHTVYSTELLLSHVFKEKSRLSELVNTPIKNVTYSTPLKVVLKRVILFEEHAILHSNYLNF